MSIRTKMIIFFQLIKMKTKITNGKNTSMQMASSLMENFTSKSYSVNVIFIFSYAVVNYYNGD